MTETQARTHFSIIANWLFFCCATVFCMVIIGAITRLSGSGLSMVEWRPLIGFIPPLNEAEWMRVFELYKSSPEFEKKNFWMELSDFKMIFFWEWFHRLLGRLIGIFYALPFIFFLIKGWIPKGYKLKLLLAFLLGGAQGFMGWYMVKSGLVDIPAVSHYRLMAHLSLALVIYGYMLWLGLTFWKKTRPQEPKANKSLFLHATLSLLILSLTIVWGAYTAGLDAGLVYNDSFPKMGNTWIPEEIWFYKPIWLNFFENHAGVQFVHRWLAIATVVTIFSFIAHAYAKNRIESNLIFLGLMVVIQLALGIMTLFSHVSLHVAVTHQAGALIVLSLLLSCMHDLKFTGNNTTPT